MKKIAIVILAVFATSAFAMGPGQRGGEKMVAHHFQNFREKMVAHHFFSPNQSLLCRGPSGCW